MKTKLQIAFLLLVSLTISGCVPLVLGAAAGAGGVYYFKDKAELTVPFGVRQSYNASLTVLKRNKVRVEMQEQDALSALVEGVFADGLTFRVHIKKTSEIDSHIEVRIWKAANKDRADMLLYEIRDELRKSKQK